MRDGYEGWLWGMAMRYYYGMAMMDGYEGWL